MKKHFLKQINKTHRFFNRMTLILSVMILLLFCYSCHRNRDIRDVILRDRKSFYYIDTGKYPARNSSLPIGVFDSGTGGLSVLNDILNYNLSLVSSQKEIDPGTDPYVLRKESYIFLADMANMPYGSYSIENNTDLLIEHILKNIQFLLGNKYYKSADSPVYQSDKSPVKAIVIACNTATAYGLDTVRSFLKKAGLDIGVIGVIDAASFGAFGNFSDDENGSIAILATDATVKSGAYTRTIRSVKDKLDQDGEVQVFQQAGIGIAEAIDENIDFINRYTSSPRKGYKGPSDTARGEMKIDLALWDRYHFDMGNGAMLHEGDRDNPRNLQINSVENYISFHLVSLMEKIKNTGGAQILNSVVLACTHYPFFEEAFRETLDRLRDHQEEGKYIYRSLIAEDLIIINPASKVADQLYQFLKERNLLNSAGQVTSEFFISVPNVLNKKVLLREDKSFTYEYKYGRVPGEIQEYVKCVPFSRSSIPQDILNRLSYQVPTVFELIDIFNHDNPKTAFLKDKERIRKE